MFIVNKPQSIKTTAQITGELREIERLTRSSEGAVGKVPIEATRWRPTLLLVRCGEELE
jgi:hypothetical protein